jgi:hypothetical protein
MMMLEKWKKKSMLAKRIVVPEILYQERVGWQLKLASIVHRWEISSRKKLGHKKTG